MADVTQRLPQAHLEMVGTGKEQPSLRTLTRELGLAERVRWHGHVPLARLPLFYNAADVFVFPRLSRATPRVMLQALACALPVITSALGALEDFVVDGETGFLVPPRDPARLAERIEALLRDRIVAERFGRAARAFACRELDWDQLVPRIRENVYQPVLAGH